MVLIRYSLSVVYANGGVGYKFCSFVPYIPTLILSCTMNIDRLGLWYAHGNRTGPEIWSSKLL